MNFSNKTVLVTGGSRGIGKNIALDFAKNGANVIICGSSDEESLNSTYKELQFFNENCMMIKSDISNYENVVNMFNKIYDKYNNIDILINNAGISEYALLTDTKPDIWQKIIDTNLNSAYYCCKCVLDNMISKKNGVIINMSSIWGIYGASCEVAYSTSKGGLNTFTKALAKEVGPSNIRVNAIICGFIDTDMNNEFTEDEKKEFIANHTMLNQIGSTQDVSNLTLFLASSQARHITGQTISVDGGFI